MHFTWNQVSDLLQHAKLAICIGKVEKKKVAFYYKSLKEKRSSINVGYMQFQDHDKAVSAVK